MMMEEIGKRICQEQSELYKKHLNWNTSYGYWDNKDFNAENYFFWKEYKGMAGYKDWMKNSVIAYLNYLNSRKKNLYLKINREYLHRLD